MRWFVLSIVSIFLFCHQAFCQEKKERLAVGFSTAFKTGWWIYHKGTTKGDEAIALGWDRTHYQPKYNLGLAISYKINKLTASVSGSLSWYVEDDMLRHESKSFAKLKYPVSNGSVKFKEVAIDLSYDVIAGEKFQLSPNIGVGTFSINTLHPERDNFGTKLLWHVGIQNKIRKDKVTWLLNPIYQELTILPKAEVNNGEKHKIHAFGIEIGLRYWLK